jgi:N-methylhydantoinase B
MTSAGLGGLKILSVEMSELLHPFTIEKMEIEPDSMGHGKQVGGPGIHIIVRPERAPMECHLFGDGTANPPFGVVGGTPGIGGGSYKENRTTGKRTYSSSKGHLVIGEDEVWVGVSSGGGGYGDPLERDPQLVADGVHDGLISLLCAREVYGVVLQADGSVYLSATEKLRQELLRMRSPKTVVTPTRPSAATWLRHHMREGDAYVVDPQ